MLRRLLVSVERKLVSQQFLYQPVTYYYTTPIVEAVPTSPTSSSKSIYENPTRNLPKPKGQSYSTLMSNAERCVDPGSFVTNQEWTKETKRRSQVIDLISLKKLLSSNPEIKRLIAKLAESLGETLDFEEVKHPFTRTAGDLFFGESPAILTPGVLVLLISKLAGHRISPSSSYAPKGDIYYSGAASDRQILLARGIVLNAAAFEFHRTIVETLEPFAEAETLAKVNSFHQGNKMAILTGDLLIVNTVRSVSALKNSRVFGLIMKTVEDFGIEEVQSNRPFKLLPNGKLRFHASPVSTGLAESHLLAVGFRSAMLLAGYPESVQSQAAKLGSVMGTLWKVNCDLNKYTNEQLELENRDELQEYLYEAGIEASNLLVLRDEEINLTSSLKDVRETLQELIRFWAIAEPAQRQEL